MSGSDWQHSVFLQSNYPKLLQGTEDINFTHTIHDQITKVVEDNREGYAQDNQAIDQFPK